MVDDTYPQMPIIETKNYLLRPARLNDAEDMFEYYKQSKVVEYLPMSSHKTVSDTRRFIKSFFIDNYRVFCIQKRRALNLRLHTSK